MPEGGNFFTRLFGRRLPEQPPVAEPIIDPLEVRITQDTKSFIEGSRNLRQEFDKECGAFWKLNPQDVADLILLAPVVQIKDNAFTRDTPEEVKKDEEDMITHHLEEIGQKMAFSILMAQIHEYYVWSHSIPISQKLVRLEPEVIKRIELRSKELSSTKELADRFQNQNEPGLVNIGILLMKIQEADKAGDMSKVLKDRDLVFDCLRLFEEYQWDGQGEWVEMATLLRQYLFPHRATKNEEENLPKFPTKNERSIFLLDRLLNAVHNTGDIYQQISNDFPKVGFLLYLQEEPSGISTLVHNASSDVRKFVTRDRTIFGEYFHQPLVQEDFIDVFLKKLDRYSSEGEETSSLKKLAHASIMLGFEDPTLVKELMRRFRKDGKYDLYEPSPRVWNYWRKSLEDRMEVDLMKLLREGKIS